MRQERIHCFAQVVTGGVLLLLATALGCCNPLRHGVILRGDWSIELNRVPWLVSRIAGHEAYSTAAGLSECQAEGETAAGGTCATPTVGDTACYLRKGTGGCRCRGLGALRDAALLQPAMVTEYPGHSRFHPVPTRPVFLPRSECCLVPEEDSDPPDLETALSPPPPEVITTPDPDADNGWNGQDSL